ncbi:alpha/beta hydrolase [Pediococcus inopinatus]|uniref:Alpha/beta hydrolase n=1 Tax=Pediococcus inopinatus TaxID=114090 RepID=A0ABZ0Q2T2_9LACO|nr:alpha/beta hydrolase [Pediococcus inopinatus]WPC19162.1 alpha/beta hydrolase [Pediococcus inopinatus]WPC20954.1 alpha/beta hydrolase [Pediococcus inopinatus]
MQIEIKRDVTYAPDLTLDEYRPKIDKLKGLLIIIHGGGWFRGDKAKDEDISTWLAQQGYLVVTPNYHLTPEGYYPQPLVDMDHLYQQVKKYAPKLPVAVIGSSVGGNMAVEMGIKYQIPAVSLSGILDIEVWLNNHQDVVPKQDQKQKFTTGASSTINQSGKDDSFYKWFILNYLHDPKLAKEATPYYRVQGKTGPMLLINSLDEFVPVSGIFELSKRLGQYQTPVEISLLPGTHHAKGYLDQVKPNILYFLTRYLKLRSDEDDK